MSEDRQGLCRSEVSALFKKREVFFSCLFTQSSDSMRSGGCSSLLMPREPLAEVAPRYRVYGWQFTPSCDDSCVRSPWRPLRTETKGPRRSTRSAPLCGGRGWCGSAGLLGLTTPWAGSSAGRGCRNWSMLVCWPSEGFLVRTVTEIKSGICDLQHVVFVL